MYQSGRSCLARIRSDRSRAALRRSPRPLTPRSRPALAEDLVRHTNGDHVTNRGGVGECSLDLLRMDLLAASVDDVLDPADVEQLAVGEIRTLSPVRSQPSSVTTAFVAVGSERYPAITDSPPISSSPDPSSSEGSRTRQNTPRTATMPYGAWSRCRSAEGDERGRLGDAVAIEQRCRSRPGTRLRFRT